MSELQNQIQITAIQQELSRKITFSEMTNAQKKSVVDQLFPNGVAFHYQDPKVSVGDFVYGWGNANFNGGGFFFGSVLSIPLAGDANLDYKYQS
jgi:hypothetical protein